jgi:predicted nucleic acid-binding Zn ribbon protein
MSDSNYLVSGADAADALLKQLGYRAENSKAADAAEMAWQQVAGETLARYSRVGKIARGEFEVIVAASAIAQECRFREGALLAGVQAALPSIVIRRIRFRTGRIHA